MLATAQRIRTMLDGDVIFHTIWHLPKNPDTCSGDCDFHEIMCDENEGISYPGGMTDISLEIKDRVDESWCPDCLTINKRSMDDPYG